METREILAALEHTRAQIGDLKAPAEPGVYSIFLKEGVRFPHENVQVSIAPNGLTYVGSSSNLASREYDTHFSSGNSGFSTLRRSIGALLKKDLQLLAIPRGSGASESNFTNYRFSDSGEKKLTAWMVTNLEVGLCPLPKDWESQEKYLITELRPVLCLTGWPNPAAAFIKQLRKECVEQARRIRR